MSEGKKSHEEIKLEEFSLEYFKYINIFFGNVAVRQIIKETKSFKTKFNKNLDFVAEEVPPEGKFEGGIHHILQKKGKTVFCSVNTNFVQDIEIHKNDTLCQSYTLLKFMENKVPMGFDNKNIIQRQMKIIQMYRNIINNQEFSKKMTDFLNKYNILDEKNKPIISDTWKNVKKKINDVLKKWEIYGYSFFMYEGNKMISKS